MPTTTEQLLTNLTPNNYLEVNWKEVELSIADLVDSDLYKHPDLEADFSFDWGEAYG